MQSVCGFMSANIGIPPLRITACAVETNDREGKITSLLCRSKADKARFNAAVPLLTATQLFVPVSYTHLTLPTICSV